MASKLHKNYIPSHNYDECGYFWNPQGWYFLDELECKFGKIQYIYIHWLNGDFEISKQKFWQSLCFGF